MSSRYAVVSLPLGVFDSNDKADAISSLSATISPDNGSVSSFSIPDFKIGTLDALVQQADDLTKLETTCHAVVAKVGESLRSVLNNDEERLASYKMVNDSKCIQALTAVQLVCLGLPRPALQIPFHANSTCLNIRAHRTVPAYLYLEQDPISK